MGVPGCLPKGLGETKRVAIFYTWPALEWKGKAMDRWGSFFYCPQAELIKLLIIFQSSESHQIRLNLCLWKMVRDPVHITQPPYPPHPPSQERSPSLSASVWGCSRSLFRVHGLKTTMLSMYLMPFQQACPLPHSDSWERQSPPSVLRRDSTLVLRMWVEVKCNRPRWGLGQGLLVNLQLVSASVGLPTVRESTWN